MLCRGVQSRGVLALSLASLELQLEARQKRRLRNPLPSHRQPGTSAARCARLESQRLSLQRLRSGESQCPSLVEVRIRASLERCLKPPAISSPFRGRGQAQTKDDNSNPSRLQRRRLCRRIFSQPAVARWCHAGKSRRRMFYLSRGPNHSAAALEQARLGQGSGQDDQMGSRGRPQRSGRYHRILQHKLRSRAAPLPSSKNLNPINSANQSKKIGTSTTKRKSNSEN